MHLLKRLASGLTALLLTVSWAPSASARQFQTYTLDASYTNEINAMLDAISTQNFVNTDADTVRMYIEHLLYRSSFAAIGGSRYPYTNAQGYWAGKTVTDGTFTQVVSATGCFSYCRFAAQVIYGTQGEIRNLPESAGRISASGLKSFLETYAQAGEHIRVDSKHSVTFVSHTEGGFYYLDYTGDQNPYIRLRYTTYENFAARCNELSRKVWIYEANNAVNDTNHLFQAAEETSEAEEIAEWFYDSALVAEQLGLTQGGDVTYTSELTLAEGATLAARVHSLFTVGGVDFQEQEGDTWYDPYVDYLKTNRIVSGDLNYPAAATREQFVSLIFAAVPEDMDLGRLNPLPSFVDGTEISDMVAVEALCRAGIVTGVQGADGVYFYPDNTITRAEAIAIVTRLVDSKFRVTQ